jgi:hypothetical protein
MRTAAEELVRDARNMRAARAAAMLSSHLDCQVTPYPGRPGIVEARGLPGVYSLVGPPEEVAAEGRKALLGTWLPYLGTLAGSARKGQLPR